MRQQKLFEVGLPRPTKDARPTRLKRFNCNFEWIACSDLPKLITDAVVGDMYKYRDLFVALRFTSKVLRAALDESLEAKLQELNSDPEQREEAFQAKARFESFIRDRVVRDVLHAPFALRQVDVLPLLFRKCCFCRRASFPRRGYVELVQSAGLPSCRILCHERCLDDRMVSLRIASNGSLKVRALAQSRGPLLRGRQGLSKVRKTAQQRAREMVEGLTSEQENMLLPADFPMRGGSSVFYFVRSHPCVPESVVLKAAVGRVLQLGCEQDPLRIDYIPVLEGAKHE